MARSANLEVARVLVGSGGEAHVVIYTRRDPGARVSGSSYSIVSIRDVLVAVAEISTAEFVQRYDLIGHAKVLVVSVGMAG